MNEDLRLKVTKHVSEIFFPQELDDTIVCSLRDMFTDYVEKAYGDADPFQPGLTFEWLYIIPDDGISQPISLICNIFRKDFALPFVKNDPELNRVLQKNQLLHEKVLDIEQCPIPGFSETAKALFSFRREKMELETLLASELRKSAFVETFLKKYPEMKPLMIPWAPEIIPDLPDEVDIDINSIEKELGAF